jgi:predicted ribonuclease toxin of YeeF-YezG toxin-antitoxin module
MDGDGSHVILKAIKQAHKFGSNMVTLPSRISHVLQALDVPCFNPFKISFKKERNGAMVKKYYCELQKVTLARWIDKVKNQTLSKNQI